MNIHNKNIVLHLSLIYGVGPAVVAKIIVYIIQRTNPDLINNGMLDFSLLNDKEKEINLSIIYTYTITDFVQNIGLPVKIAQLLVDGLADTKKLDDECALIQQYSIDLLTIFDPTYPKSLRQIHYPPLVLYCKGSPLEGPLEKTEKRMAIVGSRKASGYSQQVIETL